MQGRTNREKSVGSQLQKQTLVLEVDVSGNSQVTPGACCELVPLATGGAGQQSCTLPDTLTLERARCWSPLVCTQTSGTSPVAHW